MASRFGTDIDELTFRHKLTRFENLTMLNSRVKTNALHIMLNFDTSEKIGATKLQQIAAAYMDKIGFGDQPYLVYEHKDAAHDHIHIVTTNMQANGKRIDVHDIGKLLSEPARKLLEVEFGLVKAESKHIRESLKITPANIEKAQYGKTPTKRAITNIVSAVTSNYKYSSLAELNAVLKQFNVMADRGREDTVMFEKKGLIYAIIDEHGNKIGIPFKASSLNGKPTLKNLEEKFERNKELKKPYKDELKLRLEKTLSNFSGHMASLIIDLQRRQINVVFRQNEQGFIYGVTFIDHKNRTVFNGSDLGKAYSAKALLEHINLPEKSVNTIQQTYLRQRPQTNYLKGTGKQKTYLPRPASKNFLEVALAKSLPDYGPGVSKKKKRKKRGHVPDQRLTL